MDYCVDGPVAKQAQNEASTPVLYCTVNHISLLKRSYRHQKLVIATVQTRTWQSSGHKSTV